MRSTVIAVVLLVAAAASAGAQQRGATPPAATPPAATPPAATPPANAPKAEQPPPVTPENFTYEPGGRRDPFLNLLGAGTERREGRRVEGPAGMTVAEISVRGIMQSRGSFIAMITGPDKKTYIVHSGDKVLDGTIKTITSQEIVFVQDVNDPLSLVKSREVHKPLRTIEDAKE